MIFIFSTEMKLTGSKWDCKGYDIVFLWRRVGVTGINKTFINVYLFYYLFVDVSSKKFNILHRQ